MSEQENTLSLGKPKPFTKQLEDLLAAATAEGYIVCGVVTKAANIEHMRLFSTIGAQRAVELFAAIVKTFNKGKAIVFEPSGGKPFKKEPENAG